MLSLYVESLKGNAKYTEKWSGAEDGLCTVNALLENLGGKVEAELQEIRPRPPTRAV
jgi:hypothetical protein